MIFAGFQNIIDNEVEKDPVTLNPVIHGSGVKGALRDALTQKFAKDNAEDIVKNIFGAAGNGAACSSGTHKFLDASMLSRPMRVSGSDKRASISVVTVDTINQYLKSLASFGLDTPDGMTKMPEINFGENEFLAACSEDIKVEGENTGKLDSALCEKLGWLKELIGDDFAFVKSFENYDLPVVARNCLDEKNKNLWYEEIVPHGSVFYFAVICNDNDAELEFTDVIQFGGNASIGCGYTKISKII